MKLKGEKAYEELQRLCTANIKNEIGKCTYTHMLNEGAGIETDLTVVCFDKDHFRIISSAAVRTHDKAHILKIFIKSDVEFKDITDDLVCLGMYLDQKVENYYLKFVKMIYQMKILNLVQVKILI
jgi:glycine cleavage system aminomethyltransferase T